jgi:NAD(P)-dependent dehydrogenase (short-subunit alcohol dehydrogenase family)
MTHRLWWITGGGSGIGRALARQVAATGDKVVISGRNQAALQETAQADPLIIPLVLDVTDAAAVGQAVSAIEERHGSIDVAILNAAQYRPMDLSDFSAAGFVALMNVNVVGVANCMEPLLQRMSARRGGQIAVVASVAGYRGLPKAAAYGPGKAALINMMEALKPAADRAGIVLQVINPGFVATPMTARNEFPMPFLIAPEEAARRILGGLAGNGFEIVFPRRFAAILKIARLLPYRLYFALTRRMIDR